MPLRRGGSNALSATCLLSTMIRREDYTSGSDSDYSNSWISWFLSNKGNEYFCQVEEDYILDRFNLTGLNVEVQHYAHALDLITDNLADDDFEEEHRGGIELSARFLYGLIHARWIITSRGLVKMLEKFKKADFGRCPRVLCYGQPLLPVGLTDIPYEKSVKLYCGRCEDIYSPKSTRHGSVDGAFFGTSFPHMMYLVYPGLLPSKAGPSDHHLPLAPGADPRTRRKDKPEEPQNAAGQLTTAQLTEEPASTATVALSAERYKPKIYGFQVNETAKLQRWQEAMRDKQIARLVAWESTEV
ncbi:casein kinase 2 regulatory subunit [Serendipita sp. 401]|nr:casein kinase 2 regulatory subunit [Serendipita sp. 401]KAG9054897.1 casein kinase 2 regulatory subunit [Serendipita sp. 407]